LQTFTKLTTESYIM